MPIATAVLRAHVVDDVDQETTVYLHTGNPGANGTQNRVPSGSLGTATIAATSGWTIHATLAQAHASADVNFGSANAAVNGISHYSLFHGSTLYATRALAAAVNVANGSEVVLTGSTVMISYTSTDA